MEFYKWSDRFSIHIDDLDEAHKTFFVMMNEMYEYNEKQGRDPAFLDRLFGELFDYAVNHFANEEALFDKIGYPEAEQHRAAHHAFRQQLIELRLEQFQGNNAVPRTTFHFMRDWLLNHILEADKRLSAYVTASASEVTQASSPE